MRINGRTCTCVINDYHTHPAEPRSVRFTVTARF
jgi:hypothetical protein